MYPFLRPIFDELIFREQARANPYSHGLGRLKRFKEFDKKETASFTELMGMGLSEIDETYIAPWRKLTQEQSHALASFWNMNLAIPHRISIEKMYAHRPRALHWTFVNLYEAGLFEIFTVDYQDEMKKTLEEYAQWDWITRQFIAPEYSLPYKQCFLCGVMGTDTRGREFGKQGRRYCHLPGCPSDSNASAHSKGCCYGKWKRIEESIRIKCKRYGNNHSAIIDAFINFYEERFRLNLQIEQPVQVLKARPKNFFPPQDPETCLVYASS